jgi:glycosyltransferase involved in cell wall biosynthesis
MSTLSKIRVGFSGDFFDTPHIRGIQRYTYNLLYSIGKYHPEIQLYVFHNHPLAQYWKQLLPHVCFKKVMALSGPFWESFELAHALRDECIDLYHATHNCGLPSQTLFRHPRVLTLHDTMTHERYGTFPLSSNWRLILYYLSRKISFFFSRSANKVIAVSHKAREEIIKKGLAHETQCIVIHNGVQENFWVTPRSWNMRPVDNAPPTILYYGGFEKRKNIASLVEAFKHLKMTIKNLKLVITGDLSGNHALHQVLNDSDIKCIGFVSDQETIALLSSATCLAYPSLNEGFGLPLVEAMAAGCPVVCSDIPVFKELGGDAAVYCDTTDYQKLSHALSLVILDKELQEKMRIEGKIRAASFSWKEATQATVSLYKDLLAR